MNAIESSIASLVSDDHNVRKEAISTLPASGYQDPNESRTYRMLESAKSSPLEWKSSQLNADLENFPDFDMVYLNAAYPTGRSDDHQNAKVDILFEGLTRAKTKGDILARLSCYYTFKSDPLRSLDYATAAVLIGDPGHGPGSMVQVMFLLARCFGKVGFQNAADFAKTLKAPYNLGPTEDADVDREVKVLCSVHSGEVQWAANQFLEVMKIRKRPANASHSKFDVRPVRVCLELFDPQRNKTYKYEVKQGNVSGSLNNKEIAIWDRGQQLKGFPIFQFPKFDTKTITKVERMGLSGESLVIHVKIPLNWIYHPEISGWDITFTISGSAKQMQEILREIAGRLIQKNGNPYNLDMSNWD